MDAKSLVGARGGKHKYPENRASNDVRFQVTSAQCYYSVFLYRPYQIQSHLSLPITAPEKPSKCDCEPDAHLIRWSTPDLLNESVATRFTLLEAPGRSPRYAPEASRCIG